MAEVYCDECGKSKSDVVCRDCYNEIIEERNNLLEDISDKNNEIEDLKKEINQLEQQKREE